MIKRRKKNRFEFHQSHNGCFAFDQIIDMPDICIACQNSHHSTFNSFSFNKFQLLSTTLIFLFSTQRSTMKKSKLHFEIALFRDLSKSRDSSNSLNCEQPVVWTSYKTAHQETRKYLKRNYVTIKHNVGSLLYTNDNSLKIINSRLDPATKSMSPNDVFALNVRSIRICELQQSTATGLVGCKRSGNGASGGVPIQYPRSRKIQNLMIPLLLANTNSMILEMIIQKAMDI